MKNLNELNDFDKDFVTDVDLEDGFEESDGAKAEREAILEFKQKRREEERYNQFRDDRKANAARYNNLSEEDARGLSDEELCRLYDDAMMEKDLEDDENDDVYSGTDGTV